jgi:hypothetical protein
MAFAFSGTPDGLFFLDFEAFVIGLEIRRLLFNCFGVSGFLEGGN